MEDETHDYVPIEFLQNSLSTEHHVDIWIHCNVGGARHQSATTTRSITLSLKSASQLQCTRSLFLPPTSIHQLDGEAREDRYERVEFIASVRDDRSNCRNERPHVNAVLDGAASVYVGLHCMTECTVNVHQSKINLACRIRKTVVLDPLQQPVSVREEKQLVRTHFKGRTVSAFTEGV